MIMSWDETCKDSDSD